MQPRRPLLPKLKTMIPAGAVAAAAAVLFSPAAALAASEDQLILPKLGSQKFFGIDGHTLLALGLVIAALGIVFGLVIYGQLKALPVHESMLEVSDLIYE